MTRTATPTDPTTTTTRRGAGPFSTEAWERTAPVRAAIDALPFLRRLEDGTLPRETFTHYLAQDAHYLAEYARALAACATTAPTTEDLAFWSTAASGTVLVERQLHETHVADITAVEPSPTCTAYTSFLLALAATGSHHRLAAGVLPCFWIYQDVGSRLRDRVGDLAGHPYEDWIGTYGDPAFAESTATATAIVDRLAAGADPETVAQMHAAFARSAQYEWMFWDAADRHEQWPV